MKICHACKKELAPGREIGRTQECPFCHTDLRCCLNCRFYDRSAPKQCREPMAELVREKDKANYCDFFRFKETHQKKSGKAESEKLWNDLFRKR